MAEGLIVKALSGYYYVLPDMAGAGAGEHADNAGTAGSAASTVANATVQCRARGIFKKNKISPLVGDRVVFQLTENGEGTVDKILPRTSELVRPPVANVKLAVLVFSVDEPALNLQLLDKFLVHIECAGLDAIIALTKEDLLADEFAAEPPSVPAGEPLLRSYADMGYEIYQTSAKQGHGIRPLFERLAGTISVFSGQSGVGKSSLLNAMIPGLTLETNEISSKLGRGKHTTRHVELLPLPGGGWVADTPGFSQLDFAGVEAEDLGGCFREFAGFAERCRFRGCLHDREPGCAVREAVQAGQIAASRHEHYLSFLAEIRDRKRRY